MVEVLKVSSRSNPNSVAGALAGVLRQAGIVEVQVVGAGALNQAVKAIAIARSFVTPSSIDLVCVPAFADIEIDGESRTAIRLAVEDRNRRRPEARPASPHADHASSAAPHVAPSAPTPMSAPSAPTPMPAPAPAVAREPDFVGDATPADHEQDDARGGEEAGSPAFVQEPQVLSSVHSL